MKFRFFAMSLLSLTLLNGAASAQDIVVDWAAKTLSVYPAEVSKVFNGRLVVRNVNDVIFTYKVELVAVPRTPDDFRNLFPDGLPSFRKSGLRMDPDLNSCSGLIDAVMKRGIEVRSATADLLRPEMSGEKAKSRPLNNTLDDWALKVRPEFGILEDYAGKLIAFTSCSEPEDGKKREALAAYNALKAQLNLLQAKLGSPHQIEQNVTFSPDVDYKVTVEEIYINEKGETFPVIDGKREFSFSPISHVLSLSAGTLLTTLAQQSYLSRRDPVSGKNIVSVDGAGLARPIGVALLNYQIPQARWMKNDQMGVSLASGLTFELGSTKSDSSRVGWFGGVSLDFYHRLFITPGIHFGEFADFPVGLGKGSAIPDNFGELNPVKRWTGRFAISITYRTASFGKTAATGESKGK